MLFEAYLYARKPSLNCCKILFKYYFISEASSDTISNKILPYVPLPIGLTLLYLSSLHLIPPDHCIFTYVYLLSFPQTRYKFHEGRNFGMYCKSGGIEEGHAPPIKGNPTTYFNWSKFTHMITHNFQLS